MKIMNSIRTTLFHTKSLVIGFLLCWLFPNSVWAYDAYVNGIYYDLNTTDKTASVTSNPDHQYYEELTIPESIYNDNVMYSVTSIGYCAFQSCTGLTSVTIPNSVTSIGTAAFEGCTGLTSVTIGNSVTSIGQSAFEGCTGLTSVTIPNSVTSIGDFAFIRCTGLTSVDIPNSVTSIGDRSFSGCTGLTSVNISNSVTIIDFGAFCECTSLTSVNIPNSVTSIGISAFENCKSLTSVDIPNSVTSIGEAAFRICTSLTSVDIPSSVTSIDNEAFYGCTGLTSVTIPNSVTSISICAFEGCTGLASVTIPNSVTSIGSDAFSGCTGLTSVTIPNSVTNIDDGAFSGCGLTSVNIPSSVTWIGSKAFGCTSLTSITVEWTTPLAIFTDILTLDVRFNCTLHVPAGTKTAYENAQYWNDFGNIFEPDVLATGTCGDNLTYTIYSDMSMVISGTGEMYDYSYSESFKDYDYYQTIEKVIIGHGVTSIGAEAFIDCKGLTSVTIPNSVTSIGNWAFAACTGLTSVTIPNSVTSIDDYAFYGCTGLTSVTIPNSVTSIGENAFYGCTGFTSVKIPNSVTDIGYQAFYGCTGLTSVTISNSVTIISDNTFYGCTGLTSVTIPNSVTSIGRYAFWGCSGLVSVTIPNSVTTIGGSAFSNTPWYNNQPDGLIYINDVLYKYKGEMPEGTSISIRNGTVSISDEAFLYCTGLTSVTIPNGVTSIGDNTFEDCSCLTSVEIPNSLTSIGDYAFGGCSSLTFVTIPSSVTSIGEGAFGDCTGLTSVEFPKSVTSIGNLAFAFCTSLTSITVEWTTPLAISSDTFWGVDKSNCTLYVPAGTKTAYENAQYWNEFGTIVEMENVEDPDTDLSVYDNVVYIEGAEAFVGQQIRLSLKMNNTIEATGFQCDVYLPDGVTAAHDEDGFYLMDISEERTTSKKTDYSSSVLQPDGGLRFMCSSTRSYTFSGNEGEVAYLIVDIDPSMEGGSYPLILKNVEISDANSNPYRVSYVKTTLTIHPYTLGDANNDGGIGVSDFTAIANYIMGTPPASFIEIAADVNADDVISVSDLTGVANIILYGTVTPNASHAKARNEVTAKYANIGAKDVTATTDKEFTVAVTIDGNYAYSGYQFDMALPEGLTVKNVEGQTKASDVFMDGMIDDNTLRVLCASTMGETTESTVVNLTLVADVEGTYSIDIDNAIISANSSTYTMSNSSFLIAIDIDATGISALGDEAGSNDVVYDLTGKKLIGNGNMSSLQKGIYIVNGKIVTK